MPLGRVDLDKEDVALATGGDAIAFERLYRRHVARVRSLAQWLTNASDSDIDDAVQEVFVRVWTKLSTFAGESAFGTWLHRVAVNLLIRRRQMAGRDSARRGGDDETIALVPGPRSDPELRMAIEKAVATLPAGAREVFVLHDMEGFKHEEIGQLLEIDPGTSRSQLHRARMMLRKILA